MVGISDGEHVTTLVEGANLDKSTFLAALSANQSTLMLCTFNGSSFDLPSLERYFNISFRAFLHLDLRHLCAQIGLRGRLKDIETKMGISRRENELVEQTNLRVLWNKARVGNHNAFEHLCAYNAADARNLETIAKKSSRVAHTTTQKKLKKLNFSKFPSRILCFSAKMCHCT